MKNCFNFNNQRLRQKIMKPMNKAKLIFIAFALMAFPACDVLEEVADSVNIPGEAETGLTQEEIRNGLTDALEVGIKQAVSDASQTNGFYQNERVFIPFPPQAHKVRETALDFGLDSQVESFERTLNRAAENAASKVKPIFMNALNEMTIQDATNILHGEDDAATRYFRRKTEDDLEQVCYPEIEKATSQVELTKHWEPIIKIYNKARLVTGDPEINPDLNAYVTEKTIDGLFLMIADEERQIRENPEKRVTEILKKVFGSLD
jgi:hypothetical protein